MHEIKTDVEKNRIYVVLGGFSSMDQVDETVRQMEEAVGKVKPGFDVITDISSYRPAMPEIAAAIQHMQEFLRSSGMRRAVRVVSTSAITSMQFSRTSRSAGYQAEMVTSVTEAEKMLEQ